MLENQERLALLEKRAKRAAEHLEALEANPDKLLQLDYLTSLQVAEEHLAAAETLLVLEEERQAALKVLLSAFPGTTSEPAGTTAITRRKRTRNAGRF